MTTANMHKTQEGSLAHLERHAAYPRRFWCTQPLDKVSRFGEVRVFVVREHPLSTYAPRGRGGGDPKAYVVSEVA